MKPNLSGRLRWIAGAAVIAGGLFGASKMTKLTADSATVSEASSRESTEQSRVRGRFDGRRAFGYLVEQCRLGPRVSGTESNRKLQKRMAEHFTKHGGELTVQEFAKPHPLTGERVDLANVLARWNPKRKNRIVLGAHFDTRPFADEETNPQRRAQPFLGANDGGSGVAVLMELAHHLNGLKTTVGVDLVMFDAEELVYRDVGDYFLGSRHFAESYRANHKQDGYEYVAAVVVDMVGDRRLEIYPDHLSWNFSRKIVDEVWGVAKQMRARGFRYARGHDIRDDHEPLLDVGIPAIDIIDFDYPHWHRISDTPDKCSASSLAQVGNVLITWLERR